MYKLFLIKKANQEKIYKEFSDEETEILNFNINKIVKNSKLNWSYFVIQENYKFLQTNTDLKFSQLPKTVNELSWELLEEVTRDINKNLFNFLASLNTFLDQSLHYLSQNYGDTSNEYLKFKELTKTIYDKNFAYRLFYNLRNYTIHCGYSLNAISIEQQENSITFVPKFILKELNEFKKWQSELKKDLSKINDNFPAFDLVNIVFKNFTELNTYIQNLIIIENKKLTNQIIEILNIDRTEIHNYCFKINDNGIEKIAQIPNHYLK